MNNLEAETPSPTPSLVIEETKIIIGVISALNGLRHQVALIADVLLGQSDVVAGVEADTAVKSRVGGTIGDLQQECDNLLQEIAMVQHQVNRLNRL